MSLAPPTGPVPADTSGRSDFWDANRTMLREWVLALAVVAVLLLYELAFWPPLDAPVVDRLPPLVAVLALYAWVNGFTQRRGHYLASRIAALDREIGRVRRAQAVAGELVAAQRQG